MHLDILETLLYALVLFNTHIHCYLHLYSYSSHILFSKTWIYITQYTIIQDTHLHTKIITKLVQIIVLYEEKYHTNYKMFQKECMKKK